MKFFWVKEGCWTADELQEWPGLPDVLSARSQSERAPLEGAACVGHLRPIHHAVLADLVKEEAVVQVQVVDQSD
jgi:hypothetical protein